MEAERLLGISLHNADLTELVSTAAYDGWKHVARAESGCETQPRRVLIVFEGN